MQQLSFSAVHIWLLKDSSVYMFKRKNSGWMDGYWTPPAGHINKNEPGIDAAIREAREESGVEIDPKDIRLGLIHHRQNPQNGRTYFDLHFIVRRWNGEARITEMNKSEAGRWISVSKLPRLTVPSVREAFHAIMSGEIYIETEWACRKSETMIRAASGMTHSYQADKVFCRQQQSELREQKVRKIEV